jgi:hypothetical protein
MSMSNAAQNIRNDLKAAGFALRSFSVRSSRGGSVTVEIKDLAISKARITEIASAHEKIDRCSVTHEILSGGNTFVSVRYADTAIEPAGAALTARLHAGERNFGAVHVDTEGDRRHTWHVWSNGAVGRHLRQITPFDGEALAELLASRGELAAVLAAAPAAPAAAPELAPAPAAPAAAPELTTRRLNIAPALLRELAGES